MKNSVSHFALLLGALFVAACEESNFPSQNFGDLSAVTPSSELNMSANRVQPEISVEMIEFSPGNAAPDAKIAAELATLGDKGVETVIIYMPPGDANQKERLTSLIRILRGGGVQSTRIGTEISEFLEANIYRVEANYATVVTPPCPDWSDSGVHSYSNSPFSNMGCAIVTNVGNQVLHKEDIVRGRGDNRPDTITATKAITDWRGGVTPAATQSSESEASSSSETNSESNGGSEQAQ